MDRNFIRDIELLNFMNQGDIFLDFLIIRDQKIYDAKKAMAPVDDDEKGGKEDDEKD